MSVIMNVDEKGFADCDNNLKLLRAAMPRAIITTNKALAERLQNKVIDRYRGGAMSPLAPGTLEKRAQGKRAGRRPRIAPISSTRPLFAKRGLARLVEIKESHSAGVSQVSVGIKPRMKMSGGGTSQQVATLNELGGSFTMTANVAVRTYLKALAMGRAGTADQIRPPPGGPITIRINIPARPVWGPAIKDLIDDQPVHMMTVFAASLRAQTGMNIKFV